MRITVIHGEIRDAVRAQTMPTNITKKGAEKPLSPERFVKRRKIISDPKVPAIKWNIVVFIANSCVKVKSIDANALLTREGRYWPESGEAKG